MTEKHPHIIIIAGPNGAGKSTTAPSLLQGTLGVNEFVNADVIAQGLSAFQPETAAFHAGIPCLIASNTEEYGTNVENTSIWQQIEEEYDVRRKSKG